MTKRFEICSVEELPPGERTIVEVSGLSIGIFNIDSEYHAIANVCPHQLGELCRGDIGGIVTSDKVGEYNWERDGRIIRCPRHRWAFDITTGESVFNPHVSTRKFEVNVEFSQKDQSTQQSIYGTNLMGEPPPISTYQVEVENEIVVLYV